MSGQPWWGDFELPPHQVRRWAVGPGEVWFERDGRELRLAWRENAGVEDALVVGERVEASPVDVHQARHVSGTVPGKLQLRPVGLDRPVVARAQVPLTLAPESELVAYMSLPVWMLVLWGSARAVVPLRRPSDTWFGPSPRDGVLAYASRTMLRTHLDAMPVSPYRALCRLRLRNEGSEALTVARVRVPASRLALYATAHGVLWMEDLSVRQVGSSAAAPEVQGGRPAEAPGATRVGEPAVGGTERLVFRVLDRLVQ